MSLLGNLITGASLLLSGQTAKLPVPSDAEILSGNASNKTEAKAKDPKLELEGVAAASELFNKANNRKRSLI